MSKLNGEPASKKCANEFLLACVLNMMQNADKVWKIAERYSAKHSCGLFNRISNVPEHEWKSARYKRKAGLHWLTYTHNNVWDVASGVVNEYGGDARQIWRDRTAAEVVDRLKQLGIGIQRARMVAGALRDTGQIMGRGHLKSDSNTRRVLGRVFIGSEVSAKEAVEIADAMIPGDSWRLDFPIYDLGRNICKSRRPRCDRCYLSLECTRLMNSQVNTEHSHLADVAKQTKNA